MYAYYTDVLDLEKIIAHDNTGWLYGGAVESYYSTLCTISGSSEIYDNWSEEGGGVASFGGTLLIEDSSVLSNYAVKSQYHAGERERARALYY